jgi:methylglutaconyl-CoA hydratase
MKRQSAAGFEENLADARRFTAMLHRIHSCPRPTIARLHGAVMGGGVGLACACDFAIAETGAKFSVSEARFGILPSAIGPYLVNAVGARQAKRLALAASRIGAAEALALGLVTAVVAPEALDAAVDVLLEQLHGAGPRAQAEIKALYGELAPGPVTAEVRELTARTIARVRGTEEAREGFAAFLDKRPPAWAAEDGE